MKKGTCDDKSTNKVTIIKQLYTLVKTHCLGENCVDKPPSGVHWDRIVALRGAQVGHDGLLHLHIRVVDHRPEVSNSSLNDLHASIDPPRCSYIHHPHSYLSLIISS